MQHQRYVLLVFVVGSLLLGWTVQAALGSAFEQFAIADTRFFGIANLSTLIAVLSAIVGFGVVIRNQKAISYVDEVVDELKKVTWPAREETVRNATTVVVTTLIVATLIGLYDLLWKNVADLVLYG